MLFLIEIVALSTPVTGLECARFTNGTDLLFLICILLYRSSTVNAINADVCHSRNFLELYV